MSELTLDEAIKHCLEVAERNERKAEYRPRMDCYDEIENRADCLECAADHRQLAEWLTELKDLREENKVLISECDRLIKEKGELLKVVNRPCTLCGNNCQVSILEQSNVRNVLCEARERMYREKDGDING